MEGEGGASKGWVLSHQEQKWVLCCLLHACSGICRRQAADRPVVQVRAGGEGMVSCLKEDGICWAGEKKQGSRQSELGAMQSQADPRCKMGVPSAACTRAGLSEG